MKLSVPITLRSICFFIHSSSVVWLNAFADQFYLDGEPGKVASGTVDGSVLTLKLKEPAAAKNITYLKETKWSQENLILGTNGLAALTFCEVPVSPPPANP